MPVLESCFKVLLINTGEGLVFRLVVLLIELAFHYAKYAINFVLGFIVFVFFYRACTFLQKN